MAEIELLHQHRRHPAGTKDARGRRPGHTGSNHRDLDPLHGRILAADQAEIASLVAFQPDDVGGMPVTRGASISPASAQAGTGRVVSGRW